MKNLYIVLLITLVLGACATAGRTEEEEFNVDLKSPQISMGNIEVQFDKTFPLPGIKKGVVTLNYFPREDAVCLQYKADLMTYYQFWSRSGRTAFIKALEEYKEDYAARNLNKRGGSRAKRKYGNTDGYLIWQMSRFMTQAKAGVNIEIGYSFRENFPYFTLNQRETNYVNPLSEREIRNTQQIPMYFTRAQAEELAAMFDQQLLQGLVSGRSGGDSYVEEEDTLKDEY